MELTQAIIRYGLINAVVCIVLVLPQTYLIFRNTGPESTTRLFPGGQGICLYADFLVIAFIFGLIISWIMASLARAYIRDELVYVKESSRIEKGLRWKTKPPVIGIVIAFCALAIVLALGLPLYLISPDAAFQSLWAVMLIKALYTGLLAFLVAWASFSISAKNQYAIRRAKLYKL